MTMEGEWITDEAFDSMVTIVQWFYVLNHKVWESYNVRRKSLPVESLQCVTHM